MKWLGHQAVQDLPDVTCSGVHGGEGQATGQPGLYSRLGGSSQRVFRGKRNDSKVRASNDSSRMQVPKVQNSDT